MKTKHLFLSALTCLAFAACSNDDDAVKNPQNEVERAYIAVNFSMPGSGATTRWAGDDVNNNTYASASKAELAVDKVAFFFFNSTDDAAADPCFITVSTGTDIWDGSNDNHSTGANQTDDKSTKVILTVKNPKDVQKVVAVLNPTSEIEGLAKAVTSPYDPDETSSDVTLKTLTDALLVASGNSLTTPTISGTGESESISQKLLMSNSVYLNSDGNSVINTTPITTNNLYTTQAAAEANPITIHVERIWARVKVNFGGLSIVDAKDKDDVDLLTTSSSDLQVRLNGWWLNNTNKNAYVLKSLTAELSPWWNDYADYRSYWANSYTTTETLTSDFLGHAAYNDYANSTVDKYCLENTLPAFNNTAQYSVLKGENSVNRTSATQIVVAAEIGVMDGENFKAKEIIEYMGKYYTTDDFKTYLLSTDEFKKITKKSGDDYVELAATDITLAHNKNSQTKILHDDYKAIVQIVDDGTYKYSNTATEVAEINANLKEFFGQRKYWKDGKTYYFAKISHNTESDAKYNYAIIRNHLYDVTISGVVGLGTPVTDPEIPIIPEYPDESTESFLACKIAVLKYRVVSQSVSLGGDDNQQ